MLMYALFEWSKQMYVLFTCEDGDRQFSITRKTVLLLQRFDVL